LRPGSFFLSHDLVFPLFFFVFDPAAFFSFPWEQPPPPSDLVSGLMEDRTSSQVLPTCSTSLFPFLHLQHFPVDWAFFRKMNQGPARCFYRFRLCRLPPFSFVLLGFFCGRVLPSFSREGSVAVLFSTHPDPARLRGPSPTPQFARQKPTTGPPCGSSLPLLVRPRPLFFFFPPWNFFFSSLKRSIRSRRERSLLHIVDECQSYSFVPFFAMAFPFDRAP